MLPPPVTTATASGLRWRSQPSFRSAVRSCRKAVRFITKSSGPTRAAAVRRNIAKPSWQHDPGCSGRTANDVAAVAWNVAEYDTYGESGWYTVSGTSVATPIVAGAFALAGNATKQDGGKIFWTLSKKKLQKDLHVIGSGNNGCPPRLRGSYLCTAGTNEFGTYSGPTGWGTPNGIGAF